MDRLAWKAQCVVSRTGLVGAFRLNDRIVTRVDFSRCIIPAMALAGHQPESLNIQLLVDSIPALIHTASPDGYLDYFNKPWLEYFGVTLDKVAGWNWTAFIHPEDVEGIVAKWRACIATGETFEYESRVRRGDGTYRWIFHRNMPLRDANGNVVKWYGSSLDIEDRKQAEVLLSAEKRLLEMTASDVTLERILNVLCLFIEEQRSGTLASVLLLNPDGVYLCLAAGPNIPNEWKQQMERMPIGPCAGPCGTAAFTRSPVIVSDIATDPLWEVPEHRASALKHGLRASWSSPVLSSNGKVLGTFCMYYREPRSPEAQDLELIKSATHLVGVAIERDRAEQALGRSEAYLTEAQRLSHTGSFGWKPDTGEIVWSDETYRIFEYDRSVKSTIDSVVQRVHPQDRTEFQKVVDGASRGATDFEHMYRLLLPNGRVKHVHAIAHALQDASGNREFVGAVTDITEQRHAEGVIRQQEAELREVVDTIPAIVWRTLPDGSNTYVNKRFVEYSGSSAEQTAGSGWKALIHPDDLERHAGKWMEAIATGRPLENEVRSRCSDGQYRWQLDRGAPLRDEDGNIVKWYGVTTDIEDRKRAEEALQLVSSDLQDSKAKLEEAQRIAHVGYWEWDLTSNRVIWSDETYRIYGLRPQEYPIDIAVVRKMIHPEDLEFVFRVAEEALRGGLRTDVEHRIIRPSGELRTVHSQGDVKKDASGRPCQMFGTVQDVTERKRAEEALQKSQLYLSEGQRLAHMG